GMSGHIAGVAQPPIDPFAATQIRILAGLATFSVLLAVTRRMRDLLRASTDGKALALMSVGAFTGPLLGVSLLNKAVETVPSGVAQTITSLTPVLIIPVAVLWHGERVNLRAVLGSFLAVGGVALLML
ncbi:MAG: DMT family transporter, partial [Phycisphaerales bacterium]|nr:DMT family transporter [Phycisphaerales bacterium]